MFRWRQERETVAGSGNGRSFDINDYAPIGGPELGIEEEPTPAPRPDEGWGAGAAGGESGTQMYAAEPEKLECVAWIYCEKGTRPGQFFQFRRARTELGRA